MQNRKQAGQAAKGSTKMGAPGKKAEKQQQMQQGHDDDTNPSLTSESEFTQQGPGLDTEEAPRGKQQH